MRVYVVVRTLRVDTTEEYGSRRVDAQPVIDGVFDSYEAARAFVEPLLEAVSEDFMKFSVVEKEVTESPKLASGSERLSTTSSGGATCTP